MAGDNTDLDAGSGGDKIVTREISHGGDTAKLQGMFAMGISGTEGSYTAAAIGGDTANGLDVDVTRSALPTGASTSAKQDTAQAALDAIAASVAGTLTVGSHAVTNAGTFAVQATVGAAATSIGKAEDAAHSSGDVGVMALAVRQDTAAALAGTDADYQPLITDASGRLHVNVGNTVTVGSHAVTNAGTFVTQENGAALTSLQLLDDAVFAEDTAAQAADKGIAILAVRRDADTSLVGTDNDYANLQVNAAGSLKVAITAGAGSGGTSIADGASFTRDTTSITPAGAAVESSAPTLTNGDAAALSMTTGGALRVAVTAGGVAGVLEDAAAAGGEEGIQILAVRRDTAASSSGTDGDFSTFNVGSTGRLWTSATIDAALPAGTNGIGKLTANAGVTIGAVEIAAAQTLATVTTVSTVTNVATIGTSVTPGTAAANLGKAEDAAHTSGDVGVMALSVRQNTAAALSGTDADYQPLITDTNGRLHVIAGATTGTAEVVGDVADDAAAAGNPVLICGVAVEMDGTDPTTVSAENDAAQLRTDRARRLLVSAHHPRSFFTSADYSSAQTNATVQAAPGASLSLYITDIIISNGATAGKITLLDGSGGTVKFTLYPAINGGVSAKLDQPIRLTANTLLAITSTTVTTHAVNIGGYIAP